MKKLVLGAGIGLTAIVTASQLPLWKSREISSAQPSEQLGVPQPQVREIPPENYEIGFQVVSKDGLAEKIGFHLTPRWQVYASDFVPLSYEIPGVLKGVRQLPMGAIGATIKLAKPHDLSGKRFILYGMHPVTREREQLYERPFDTFGQRAHEPKKKWY